MPPRFVAQGRAVLTKIDVQAVSRACTVTLVLWALEGPLIDLNGV